MDALKDFQEKKKKRKTIQERSPLPKPPREK